MRRTTLAAVPVATAAVAGASHAGFVGWAASVRSAGDAVLVDVFANFDAASDRVLNVFAANVAAAGTSFVQDPSIARKAWAPQPGQSGSDRDSFMTVGGAIEGGPPIASSSTGADPNFASVPGAWSGTPGSAPMTTVPANAGWYATNPAATEIIALDLDSLGLGGWQGREARYGEWVAHLAFDASTASAGDSATFDARVGYKASAGPGGALYGIGSATFAIPAPGAIALLGAAGMVGLRRRRQPAAG